MATSYALRVFHHGRHDDIRVRSDAECPVADFDEKALRHMESLHLPGESWIQFTWVATYRNRVISHGSNALIRMGSAIQ